MRPLKREALSIKDVIEAAGLKVTRRIMDTFREAGRDANKDSALI